MRGWSSLLVTTERDGKKTGGGAKVMDRRGEDWEEHCDTPTTSISHAGRGSTLTAKRAGPEDGKEEKVEE